MKKFPIYLSLLKYSVFQPKRGFQILKELLDSRKDAKYERVTYNITPLNLTQVLDSLFPETEFSVTELNLKLLPLQNHIKNFFNNLQNMNFPSKNKPYPIDYTLDTTFGFFLYSICKIIKPEIVVETGVAYGLSSTFILQALHENQKGKLCSIDYAFRPWESKKTIGSIIPEELKNRWKFIFGPSSEKLSKLLDSLGKIDIFFHDSLHTYKNMQFEFETAWPFIKNNGFLLSDDVLCNGAFYDFYSTKNLRPLLLSQKNSSVSLLGILQKS